MTQQKLVLAAVMTTSFVVPFMGNAINLAIPAIGESYHVSPASLSWVVSIYILGSVAILLPMGKLADLLGRKRIYTTGVVLMALFTLLCGFAWSVESLLLFRLGQGLASSMLFSTGMAMIISVHQPNERGKVIGLSAAATYVGLSMGPIVGGYITHFFNWQSIFFVTAAILALLSLTTIRRVQDEWYGDREGTFDYKGSLYYSILSPAILYGLSALFSDGLARWWLAFGAFLLVFFIYNQARSQDPIFDVKLFSGNTVFAMSNLAAMINYSATFAISFSLSLYLQLVRGLDASTAGLVLLIQPVLMAIFSPVAGSLSDKVEPRIVASIGMALNTIGLALLAFLNAQTPFWMICAVFSVIGIGFALFSSPNNNAIMGAVEAKQYGVAASVLATMRLGGQAVSMAIVTAVLSLYETAASDAAYGSSLLEGICVSFGIFALLCTLGTFASMARGKRQVHEN